MERSARRAILVLALGVAPWGCYPEPPRKTGAEASTSCGPCGTLATGDYSPSGDPKLDGFLRATGTVQARVEQVRFDFEDHIRALDRTFGLDAMLEVDADHVAALLERVANDLAEHAEGGLYVNYTPPTCGTNLGAAVAEQARCEAKAGCDVEVDARNTSVRCEGLCSGQCEGECSGPRGCVVKLDAAPCGGDCQGTCFLDEGASCEGTCYGECSGFCSNYNAELVCAGNCSGECTGLCTTSVLRACDGRCTGSCFVDPDSNLCTGNRECHGSCDGMCTGSCLGEFEPPSAAMGCSATAGCRPQAKANAFAELDCSSAAVELSFVFQANLSDSRRMAFLLRVAELEWRSAEILRDFQLFDLLFLGESGAETVFEPPPLARLKESVGYLAHVEHLAEFDVVAARIPCVVPAFTEATEILEDLERNGRGTLEAQALFAEAFARAFR
jgi:hypothetical protein